MRKNIPTTLYADHGDKIVIRTRASGGEMPRQARKAVNDFDIFIGNKKFTVYYNVSTKAKFAYYYLNFNNNRHWIRNNIRNHTRYKT